MNINYPGLVANLSGSRLKTYTNRLGCATDAETIKLFFLFQDISAHLFTPLQLLEVTLRNGIHAAVKAKRGRADWYDHINLSNQSNNHLAFAKTSATGDLANIRPVKTDDIVCRLPFGFWVYMLDATYRNNSSPDFIWDQFLFPQVFPNAGTLKSKQVFIALREINALRNRLFHHEPVWNGHGVSSIPAAFNKIKAHYQNLAEIIGWMSADQRGLLSAWGFDGRFALACDHTRFDRALW